MADIDGWKRHCGAGRSTVADTSRAEANTVPKLTAKAKINGRGRDYHFTLFVHEINSKVLG